METRCNDTIKDESDEEDYHFTLFSDIKKNYLDIRNGLSDKVSEVLHDELITKEIEVEAIEVADEVETVSGVPDEDVPLAERIGTKNLSCKTTKRLRSCREASKRNQRTNATRAPTNAVTEMVVLSDSDCEIVAEEQVKDFNADSSLNVSDMLDSSIDLPYVDENTMVSVKINWMELRVHRFEIRKFQKFTAVFDQLAEIEQVPKEKILLVLRDKIVISKDDSPDSLNLTIVDIIEGGITKEVFKNVHEKRDNPDVNKGMLEFKCVLKDWKKPLIVFIKKTDTMQHLMIKASEQLEQPLEKLKFMFEGDVLDSDATPEDLELDGGEVIEVCVRG